MGQSHPRRLRAQRLEEERLRAQRLEEERLRAQRLEEERLAEERLRAQRLEEQRLRAQRLEEQRLRAQRLEEQIREQILEAQRLKEQRLEAQRLRPQRLEEQIREQLPEAQRLQEQRLEAQRLEAQRLEEQRLEEQPLKGQRFWEQLRAQRLEEQRLREQILEAQRLEEQRLEAQRLWEQPRLEAQRFLEQQRLEAQRRREQRLREPRLEAQRLREQILAQILGEGEQMLERQRLREQIQEGILREQGLEEGTLLFRLEEGRLREQILEQQRLIFEQQRLEEGRLWEQIHEQQSLIFEQQRLREQRLEGLRLEGLVLREQILEQQRLWEQMLDQPRLIFEQRIRREQELEEGRLWEQILVQQRLKFEQGRLQVQRLEHGRLREQILKLLVLREQGLEGLILEGLVLEQGRLGRLQKKILEQLGLRIQIHEQLGLEGLKLQKQIIEEGRLNFEQRRLWEQILKQGRLNFEQHRLRKQRFEQLRHGERRLQEESLGQRRRSLTRDFEAIRRLCWRMDMEKSSEAGTSGGESSAMGQGLSLTRDFEGGNSEAKILGTIEMGKGLEAGTSDGESSAIDYEVFLSFRGPDTRQGFMDCLYHKMREANIRVFLDKEDLHVGKEIGDELPMAIEKSKIYIPIFSKGYASSAWCLRELAHMVECMKSKPYEKEIMPIFYDVKPYDVKLKSQLYVGALEEHEEKFGCQNRRKWEDALKSVAQIKGWELKEQGHWNFITSMIREILMKLKIKDKHVTKHLVGMDERVEAVVKLLDVDLGGMRFVIIHGMGGIGKTTLAKVVFNKQNSLFSHCCFLANVRESSRSSGFVALQKKILSNMFGSGFHDGIDDDDDGTKVIAQRLSNKKVFIVLDDVNDKEQLEKLAIDHISFGSGSRIIMTTRNRSIVEADYTFKYKVNPLDDDKSLELLSRHAFGRNAPPDDYVSLSRRVVCTIGGLPLALEVIGSLLCCQNRDFWMDILDDLREIPHEKVQDKLKISFNALNHQQK